jgi:arabinofuranan 3-O-arabinosyltransferase
VSRLQWVRDRPVPIVVCVLLTVLAFVQDPGRIASDTKLDLTEDPWGFLSRTTDLWDPIGFAGQLQNQAYGYLFPMGPFFAVGDTIGLPPWVVQRLWWALVLCVGFTGIYVLARRLGIGSPAGQLIAGVAYALSPRMLSTLGPVSAEAWPMALAPWVIVPLVMGSGRGSYRRRALLSGLVVAAMGGVNAALVLAAVAPAALYLLTRSPGERSPRLVGWWVVSVIAATAWWVVPLVLLGANSPPFLDYIESAAVTTDPTSLAEVVRGTSHWVGYLGPGLGSPWQAGHDLVTEPALILDTVVVAAVGLAGLTLRRLPERGWLVVMLLVGALALTFGHGGPGTVWFTGAERDALDGLLAPLRNIHKFDPLIRIPLVLGLAHALGVVVRRARDDRTRTVAWAVVGMTALAVVGGSGPALAGRVAPEGSYDAVPAYWKQTADWLDTHADSRTLLVPGSRFGVYYWGATNDEPLQALSDAPWEVRNAIPLVPPGHIRLLDAIEQRFATGQPSDGLAAYLARADIGHLVVRNDLDQTRLDTPRPVLVHQVLAQSPGFSRVAAFGPRVTVDPGEGTVLDHGLQSGYPAVEIWAVSGPRAAGGPTSPVSMTSLSDVTTVVGGPESLLDLADAGALPSAPTVLAADDPPAWAEAVPAVLTDGLRRREVLFGASLDNASSTLTRSDPLRLDQPASDYLVSDDPRYETVADWIGVRDVAVSSSASDAGAWGGSQPALQPAAAFDQRTDTAWRADPATTGESQWMRVDLDAPVELDIVQVVLPRGLRSVGEVVVDVDGGSYRVTVGDRRWIAVDLDGAPTGSVTVELRPEPGATDPMGIAELELPGVTPRRTVRMPDVLASTQPPSAVVATAPAGYRAGCVETTTVVCAPSLDRAGEEDAGLEREITLPSIGVYALTARLAPMPGPTLDRWVSRLAGLRVDVSTSSSGVDDPRGGPLAAVDGRPDTGWVAGPFDAEPTIELRWDRPIAIESLRLGRDDDLVASAPSRVVVATGRERHDVAVAADGTLDELPSLRTRRLTLRLHDPVRTSSYDPATEQTTSLPIGVSEIEVDGEPLGTGLTSERAVRLPCGRGPNVVVDGILHRTQVDATLRDLVELRSVEARLCEPVDSAGDPTPEITLTEGSHALSLPTTRLWRPLSVTLADARWQPDRPVEQVEWSIADWGRSERRIDVGTRAGPALLAVRENANAGWVATMDGEQLESVTVDGWQQGYVVPPGPAGTIELRYAPTTGYRVALLVGLGLVVLMAVVVALDRRPAPSDPRAVGSGLSYGRSWTRRTPSIAPAPRRSPPALGHWRRFAPWVGAVAAFGCLGGAIGVAVALAVGAARILLGRWRRLGPTALEYGWAAATFGVYGAVGVLLAWRPAGSVDYAGDGWAAQILTLAALAMVVAVALTTRPAAEGRR